MTIDSDPHPLPSTAGRTPATAPLIVADGRHPALRRADGLLRHDDGLGRCVAPAVTLALRLDARTGAGLLGTGRFRVCMRLAWDEETVAVWRRHAGERHTGVRDGRPRSASAPRVVLVRAQGELRAAAVLTAPRPRAKRLYGQVSFDFEMSELVVCDLGVSEPAGRGSGGGGLLTLELSGVEGAPVPPPGDGGPAVADNAVAGLVVESVSVEAAVPGEEPITPRSYERLGILGMGGLAAHEHDRAGPFRLRAGLLLVNPVRPEALRLRVRPVGRRHRQRREARPQGRYDQPAGLAMSRTHRIVQDLGRHLLDRTAEGVAYQLGRPVHPPLPGPGALPELRPRATGLATGEDVALRTYRKHTYWEIVVPARGEPVMVALPGIPEFGGYRLMCCAPEPLGSEGP